MKPITELHLGRRYHISSISRQQENLYLLEMGFTPGEEIQVLSKSPFNGPISVALRGTVIALRQNEANLILC